MPEWSGYLCSRETGTQGERASESNPLFPLSFFPSHSSIPHFLSLLECCSFLFSLSQGTWWPQTSAKLSNIDWNKTNWWCCDRTDLLFHALWMARHLKEGRISPRPGLALTLWTTNSQSIKLDVFGTTCLSPLYEAGAVSSHYCVNSCSLPSPISTTAGNNLQVSLFRKYSFRCFSLKIKS